MNKKFKIACLWAAATFGAQATADICDCLSTVGNYMPCCVQNWWFGKTADQRLREAIESYDFRMAGRMAQQAIACSANVNALDTDGRTLLHWAAALQRTKIARLLLDAGADVNAVDKDGNTPLHEAAGLNAAIVKLLIDKGADVNACNNDGFTPLHEAVWHNYTGTTRLVELLIAAGSDVHARDKNGRTPLHEAEGCAYTDPGMTKLLIDKGADVDAADKDGNTPLHCLVRRRDHDGLLYEVMDVLIAAGADMDARDNDGNTPLAVATLDDSWDICRRLISSGATVNKNGPHDLIVRILFSVDEDCVPLIKQLAQLDTDRVWLNRALLAVRFSSTRERYWDAVQALLDAGADVNARGKNGRTPLHKAEGYAYTDPGMTKLLIDRGANVNAVDDNGETSLDNVIFWNDYGRGAHQEVVELLRAHGAKMGEELRAEAEAKQAVEL